MTAPTLHLTGPESRRRVGALPTVAPKPGRRWVGGVFAAVGGAAIAAGALMPWLTFYAGLQTIAGTRGGYGKAMLAAGVVVCLVGVARTWISRGWMPLLFAITGTGALGGGALLCWRAWQFTGAQSAMMLVPRLGPGLFVVMTGGALLLASAWRTRRGVW